jgi:uncharacterized membrane protein (UPF0127 family)
MASTQQQFRLTTSAGTTVAGAVVMADNPWQRFVGLMGKRELAADSGLCLRPCSSIHMFFMRFPLDVVFIDADGHVVRMYHGLRPWRVSRVVRKAKAAIELPSGALARAGVGVGDLLTMS